MLPLASVPFLFGAAVAVGVQAALVRRTGERDGRWALLLAAVAMALVSTFSAEILGAFHELAFGPIMGIWCAALAAAAAWAGRELRAAGGWRAIRPDWSVTRGFDRWLLAGVGVLAAVTLAQVIVGPANSIDAMAYHLPRILHWLQNGDLRHYPTHQVPQLGHFPGTEIAMMHLFVLGGSDVTACLVVWAAAQASFVAASLVVKELGGGARAQILAVAFAASQPRGLLQIPSGKNDWWIALWVLVAAAFLARAARERRAAWIAPAGAAVGLAAITKLSAPVLGGPVLAYFGWRAIAACRVSAWRPALVGALLAAALVAPHAARNIALFHTPIGEGNPGHWPNRLVRGPGELAVRIARNVALHFATGIGVVDSTFAAPFKRLVDPDDPNADRRIGGHRLTHPVFGGSPLHAAVVLLALVALAAGLRATPEATMAGCVLAAFVLFATTAAHQGPNTRLLFPLFIIGAPAVGLWLARSRSGMAVALAAILIAAAGATAMFSVSHALAGSRSVWSASRDQRYFTMRPDLAGDYRDVAAEIRRRGCKRIGLVLDGNDTAYEYPLWTLLGADRDPTMRIEHVGVENQTAPLALREPFASFRPEVTVSVGPARPPPDVSGEPMILEASFGKVSLWVSPPQRAR